MPDRDKVIKGFECCVIQGFDCYNCTYGDATTDLSECHDVLLKDALELLKEQEPVPVADRWDTGYYYVCGNCGRKFGILAHDPVYCPDCGRKVKWDG